MLSPTLSLHKLASAFVILSLLSLAACEKKKTSAEVHQEKIDAFRKHEKIEAIKAYTDLVNKYPESEHIAAAKERLKVLGPLPATPTPAKKK
jgi:hypothetical protein